MFFNSFMPKEIIRDQLKNDCVLNAVYGKLLLDDVLFEKVPFIPPDHKLRMSFLKNQKISGHFTPNTEKCLRFFCVTQNVFPSVKQKHSKDGYGFV